MTIQEFEKLIEENNLTDCKEMLMNQFRPAIDILPYRGEVKLGQSHFGGAPDLPQGTAWPTYKGVPYIFVGQINFAELPHIDVLPKVGLLSVFVTHFDYETRVDEVEWHGDDGYAHLIYTPNTDALAMLPIPDNTISSSSVPVKFSLTGDIAANGLPFNPHITNGEQEIQIQNLRKILHPGIKSLLESMANHELYYKTLEGKRHRLMGYFESCQIDAIDPGPEGYIPLFIVDTCHVLGWSWGDGNMMCISIQEDRLKNADFSSFHVHHD